MKQLTRITLDPAVMGGKACIRGLRVTVGTVVGLLTAGRSREEILKAYPYLEPEDIDQALAYAAWRVELDRKPREGWEHKFPGGHELGPEVEEWLRSGGASSRSPEE